MSRKPSRPNGVEFPVDAKGERSTTEVNQATFVAAIAAVDSAAAEAARAQRGWRFGYIKHLVSQVETAAKSSENALRIADAGLQYLHSIMEFVRGEKSMKLSEAMASFTSNSFDSGFIQGQGRRAEKLELEVPYKGKVLKGDALRVQIDKWVTKGVIELSCGASLLKVCDTPQWLDMSDRYVVLLGASSAMGPVKVLLALGANVIGIDLDRPQIWAKLVKLARESSGTLTFPMKRPQTECKTDEELFANSGCDLIGNAPEIRNWLLKVAPGKHITVGAYAYLDGPLFVRISVAMDAIIQDLVEQRKDVSLAYLCTPTDAHLVPAASVVAAADNHRRSPLWQQLFALAVGFTKSRMSRNVRKPVVDDEGNQQNIVDAVVGQQGPNYILAKRLQHWRAIVSREKGCVVSSNIAPSTATVSVVSNFSFKLAYGGMEYFRPMEVFQEDTSNAVMSALLINDLRNEQSAANPKTKLRNPMNLFTENSFHGGAWRIGWKFGCIGTPSVVSYLTSAYIVTGYLVLYNLLQTLGWAAALILFFQHVLSGSSSSLWSTVGPLVFTCTMATVLEVVHSLVGAVRAPVLSTAIQIVSRVALAQIVNYVPGVQDVKPWLYMMVFAWSLTETIRYLFYALNLLNIQVSVLTWLRYSLFIVLYPLGVSGEIGVLASAIPSGLLTKATNSSSPFLMRTVFGPLFNWMPFWLFVAVAYGPGLFFLYSHMLKQRSKVLKQKSD